MKNRLWFLAFLIFLASCKMEPDHDVSQFVQWQAKGSNRADSAALQSYLASNGVGNAVTLRQLLRSDSKWRICGAEPFDVPPRSLWRNMVPTLRLVRDEVKPLVGPVEAQSVFRAPGINRCIRGASRSYHLKFHAIDMRPTNGTTRKQLIEKLCALHASKGKSLNMGLGIYSGTRFHIDTAGYRRWGNDHRAASSPCKAIKPPTIQDRPASRR